MHPSVIKGSRAITPCAWCSNSVVIQGKGPFLGQALDVSRRQMAFDDVDTYAGGLAGTELLRYAHVLACGSVAHVTHLDLEAVDLQVLHPQVAAAVGVFLDLHWYVLRHSSALKICG